MKLHLAHHINQSKSVINKLLEWFFLFGFPRKVHSDGGPQFRSEFVAFCEKFSIVHELSSPYNSQSNGVAEASVKNVKNLMLKSNPADFDENFSIWSTTRGNRLDSPASLFFKCHICTSVPILPSFQPLTITSNRRHNTQVDKLKPFASGTKVQVQNHCTNQWMDIGHFIDIRPVGQSYSIQFTDGSTHIRNHCYIHLYYK